MSMKNNGILIGEGDFPDPFDRPARRAPPPMDRKNALDDDVVIDVGPVSVPGSPPKAPQPMPATGVPMEPPGRPSRRDMRPEGSSYRPEPLRMDQPGPHPDRRPDHGMPPNGQPPRGDMRPPPPSAPAPKPARVRAAPAPRRLSSEELRQHLDLDETAFVSRVTLMALLPRFKQVGAFVFLVISAVTTVSFAMWVERIVRGSSSYWGFAAGIVLALAIFVGEIFASNFRERIGYELPDGTVQVVTMYRWGWLITYAVLLCIDMTFTLAGILPWSLQIVYTSANIPPGSFLGINWQYPIVSGVVLAITLAFAFLCSFLPEQAIVGWRARAKEPTRWDSSPSSS